jgi:hypothetical protein
VAVNKVCKRLRKAIKTISRVDVVVDGGSSKEFERLKVSGGK